MKHKIIVSTGGGAAANYIKPCSVNMGLKFNTFQKNFEHNHITFNE